MTTVVVSGAVANKHGQGGSIWVRMSWAEALRRLGFDVVFVEQLADHPAKADTFATVMEEFGFEGSAALIGPRGEPLLGMSRPELMARAGEAELLVNLGGHLRWRPLLRRARRRAFVDLDPGFTQIWHAQGHDVGFAGHDLYFSVGENVGTRRCELPTGGIRWRSIRQPVVLERWPVAEGDQFSRFTTVANWRGPYGRLSWAGRTYGLKAHEFRRFLAVPGAAGLPFELALGIDPADWADSARLDEQGWRLVDPRIVADTSGFHRFIRTSGAEFSVAQGVYVETRSGWFSDRTVRYLASGRPALVQDTGFSDHIPVGEGLVAFRNLEEAVNGARRIVESYERHRAAARQLAEEYFAPERALAPLLDAAEVAQ
jgi:hypothetical protein